MRKNLSNNNDIPNYYSKQLVSIIIPVYNVEDYFDKCMRGVVAQTYENIEVILIDDGSKDKSGALCDDWAKKDGRITVIHQENRGLSHARNVGISEASGDWLLFVDSDDVVAPNMVERLLYLARLNNAEIAICGIKHIFNADKNVIFNTGGVSKTRVFNREEATQELWYQNSFLPCACGKIYKQELFEAVRFTEEISYEDINIMHLLFWQCNRIAYSNIELYGYLHRENSITTENFCIRDCYILKIANNLLRFAQKNDKKLLPAAKSYAVTAAFRVYLNAPSVEQYYKYVSFSERQINKYYRSVLRNRRVRLKTKIALLLYKFSKPMLRMIYSKKNRWV